MPKFNLRNSLSLIVNYIFFLCLFPLFAFNQPNLEWKVEYPTSEYNFFYGMQVDSEGNLLYGIEDSGKWKILKYNSDGLLLGEFSYEFPDVIGSRIECFMLDDEDNIIVAGSITTQFESNGFDFFRSESELMVAKFSPQGNILWAFTKAGIELTDNYVTGVDIDKNNNIYITGYYATSFPRGAITIMLDENGNTLWEVTSSIAFPRIIKFLDNKVITVGRNGASTWSTLHFITYDLDGNLISENQVADRFSFYHRFDDQGNAYTYSPSTNYKINKFNINGNREWSFEELTNLPVGIGADYLNDIAIDSHNNVFVTGNHYGGNYDNPATHSRSDILTIKLNIIGQEIWRHRYEHEGGYTQESGSNIILLKDGSLVITGNRYNEDRTNQNEVVYLLNPNGELVWLIDYDSGFMNKDRGLTSRVVNNALYVIGQTTDDYDQRSYLLKKYILSASCENPPITGEFLCR